MMPPTTPTDVAVEKLGSAIFLQGKSLESLGHELGSVRSAISASGQATTGKLEDIETTLQGIDSRVAAIEASLATLTRLAQVVIDGLDRRGAEPTDRD